MNREDGLKNFIRRKKARPEETSHTLMMTDTEAKAIRSEKLSVARRIEILEDVKSKEMKEPEMQEVSESIPSHTVRKGRPEMIARDGQQGITSKELGDLVLAKLSGTYAKCDVPFSGTKVNIHTWANVTKTFRCWGDYWFYFELSEALSKLGYHVNVAPGIADITIYLRGGEFRQGGVVMANRINPNSFNVLWIFSHPDAVTKEELRNYDYIICLAESMIKRLIDREMCPPEKICPIAIGSCSNMEPPEVKDERFDILFIGNARGQSINPHGRDVVKYLREIDDSIRVGIYGMKWDLPHLKWVRERGWWQGNYYPYHKLNELYAGSKIVINDTHPDMAKFGFIPVKIFDIVRSGGFVLTDYIKGMDDLFGGTVQYFDSKDPGQFVALLKYYLGREKERGEMSKAARAMIDGLTYDLRAGEIVNYTDNVFTWIKRSDRWPRYVKD